jgi:hypothetical protein
LTRIGDLLPLCFAGGIESPSSRRLAFTSYEFDTGQLAMGRRLNTASADEHQRLHLDPSGRIWIEAWTDYVGDQSRAEWLSHEEAARWYTTAHWDDWRCGLSDAPQELSGLVREIGNHRVLSAYTAHGAVSCTASS